MDAYLEACCPGLLVQVQEHFLLEVILRVADVDGVVVPVEVVDEGLDGGLAEVTCRGREKSVSGNAVRGK
jgi:hypothetical protein